MFAYGAGSPVVGVLVLGSLFPWANWKVRALTKNIGDKSVMVFSVFRLVHME